VVERIWRYFGVWYQRVGEDRRPAADWLTGRALTYDVDHADALLYLGASGRLRFVVMGAPNASGAPVASTLRRFLDAKGLAHQVRLYSVASPRDGEKPRTGAREGDAPRTGAREGGVPRTNAGERPNGRSQIQGFQPQTPREQALYQMILEMQREMAEMRQVAEGTGKLKGGARRRAEAALARIVHTPEPLDEFEARARFDAMLAGKLDAARGPDVGEAQAPLLASSSATRDRPD
jgi:hypothetical protein